MASRASTELKASVAGALRRLYRVASADAPKLDQALDRLESRADVFSVRFSAMEQELAGLRSSVAELATSQLDRLESVAQVLSARSSALEQELASLRGSLAELATSQSRHYSLAKALYDDIARLREQLRAMRRTQAYRATFANRNPLVSVPIATYNLSSTLIDRAIASVRAQTYERWEVIVVGDGCTDDTAERVEALGDPRVRFVNLPFRTRYPEVDGWLVSGTMPYNRAVELCRGDWIAPLDDDDEFLPGHIARLLELALERRAEFVYGALEQVGTEPEHEGIAPYLFAFPPVFGQIGMQASLHLRSLDFFECDYGCWIVGEPVDWNVIRRMQSAGVIMAATEEVVARYYPSGGRRHL